MKWRDSLLEEENYCLKDVEVGRMLWVSCGVCEKEDLMSEIPEEVTEDGLPNTDGRSGTGKKRRGHVA